MLTYDRIRELCAEKGVTITACERELGFSKGSLTKIGKNVPAMDRVKKLADYFGITIDELTEENTNKEEWHEKFIDVVSSLLNGDDEDIKAAGIDVDKFYRILDLGSSITLSQAFDVADQLGLSLDEILRDESKKTTLSDGLDEKIFNIIASLTPDKQEEAVRYLRYLAST